MPMNVQTAAKISVIRLIGSSLCFDLASLHFEFDDSRAGAICGSIRVDSSSRERSTKRTKNPGEMLKAHVGPRLVSIGFALGYELDAAATLDKAEDSAIPRVVFRRRNAIIANINLLTKD